MFVDNTKKIIVLSVPGTDIEIAELFFRQQFQLNSTSVHWLSLRIPRETDAETAGNTAISGLINSELPEFLAPKAPSIRVHRKVGRLFAKISDIIFANVLNAPWHEYQIYGMCTNPVDRMIMDQEEMAYVGAYRGYLNAIKENEGIPDYIANRSWLSQETIRAATINSLTNNFLIENNLGYNISEPKIPDHVKPQSLWLKHQDQVINHIIKYDNYTDFVAAVSSNYDIDASLYNDMERISSRKTNLTANDLSEELRNKILEFYAEDKALYDSL